MKQIQIPKTSLTTGVVGLGCMRIAALSQEQLYELVRTALDLGINFFDHADIYGQGKSEELFGQVLQSHPELRNEMIIQTKCDIVAGFTGEHRYETSAEYIVRQAKASIEKLHCGWLDILLLHRPDPLMDPRDVAVAFNELQQAGLVRHFGVSNFPPRKIELLQKFVSFPLITDQIQLSVVHAPSVDEDVFFNMSDPQGIERAGFILDYALEKDLLLQAWCPLQASWEEGSFLNHPGYRELNAELDRLAEKYSVSPSAIAAAWILRLPQKMQVIAGTTSPAHLQEMAAGADVTLTAQEWYDLYTSVHHPLP